MIIRSEELRECCGKILQAVNGNDLSVLTETLELKAQNGVLELNVTNKEYFTKVKFKLDSDVVFHAAVKAGLFLSLISRITTENIELTVDSNSLVVKGNGNYKLPMIYEGDNLLELPEIKLNNITCEMSIPASTLVSVLEYNSKELTKGTVSSVVQKLYYLDEQGAITFTSGACVNKFTLEKPIKLLLNNRLVKLFKLFRNDNNVKFELAYDNVSDTIVQTKVKFITEDVEISAILSCDDSLLNSVPVTAIRSRAAALYPYSVVIKKDALVDTIGRLMLFTDSSKDIKNEGTLQFQKDTVVVWDTNKHNFETVPYANSIQNMAEDDCYEAMFDMQDLSATLDSCKDEYVTINFGDGMAAVFVRGNVYNVIPEIVSVAG